jgi:hypothetical protein
MAFLIFITYGSIYTGSYSALLAKDYGKTTASLLAAIWPVTTLVSLSRTLFLAIYV